MSFDFHQEVHEIEIELINNGLPDLGLLLKNSVQQGSTETEIFMELRYNLKNIKKHKLDKNLINKIDSLIKQIDKALDNQKE
tara:strand:- start:956 stop:1201 length:246 start_codon:yes stop_codon:yes gene_type:complete